MPTSTITEVERRERILSDHRWLASNRLELRERFEGQYVAIHEGNVVAFHQTLASLRAILESRGMSATALVDYIEPAGEWVGV